MKRKNSPPIKKVTTPWYREFWAWFVLAPLIVVVCVSSYTVSLAVRDADDRVIDNYYKEGRMINARLTEDLVAAQLQLSAAISFDQSLDELVVRLQQEGGEFPLALILELSHPADKTMDRRIQLLQIAQGQYHAELNHPFNYRWYLQLRPDNTQPASSPQYTEPQTPSGLWRLRGEINFAQQSSVRLTASL